MKVQSSEANEETDLQISWEDMGAGGHIGHG